MNKLKITFLLMLVSTITFAQVGFATNVDDVGGAPIPGFLLAMVIGAFIGVRKLLKK